MANRLYFGDNLGWLRNTKEFPNAGVDLVFLGLDLYLTSVETARQYGLTKGGRK